VCNMAVDERFRRRGYGSALLAAAEAVARLGGQADVYLHIRAQDAPARRLYEGAGYEQVGACGLRPAARLPPARACRGSGRRGWRGGDSVAPDAARARVGGGAAGRPLGACQLVSGKCPASQREFRTCSERAVVLMAQAERPSAPRNAWRPACRGGRGYARATPAAPPS